MSEKQAGESLLYAVWLADRVGQTPGLYRVLLGEFGTPADVYRADFSAREESIAIRRASLRRLSDKSLDAARRTVDFCVTRGITILTPEHEEYPSLLRDLPDLPAVLYVRGRLPDFAHVPATAVGGTRKMTAYGMKRAYALGYGLGRGGSAVVSGMAAGGDSLALCGALDAGGFAVAVLGCGVDRAYPSGNRYLMEELAERGAVISEYPPGTDVSPGNFPVRNRIISGLCRATVVTEADAHSGALITARCAKNQGRELFAVPGAVGEKGSEGVNRLLADGAAPALTADDVLRSYAFLYPDRIRLGRAEPEEEDALRAAREHRADVGSLLRSGQKQEQSGKEAGQALLSGIRIKHRENDINRSKEGSGQQEISSVLTLVDEKTGALYRSLPEEVFTPDEVTNDRFDIGDVLCALTVLECHSLVRALPGGKYQKI